MAHSARSQGSGESDSTETLLSAHTNMGRRGRLYTTVRPYFLLVDLWEIFFRFRVGGEKKLFILITPEQTVKIVN